MKKIIIKGRGFCGGIAEGKAVVTPPIAFCSGVDPNTGVISERLHPMRGVSLAGKILVLPSAKGSSAFSKSCYACRLAGCAPIGVVVTKMNPQIAQGVIAMKVPAITEPDQDPMKLIETGDYVRINGDTGVIEITKE